MTPLAIPFGLAMGVAVGTLGGGGSVLAVPVLVYVLGQSVPEATTGSLIIVAVGAVAGTIGHARAKRVCWRHAGCFTVAAVPGIAAGTVAAESASGSLLLAGFALVMLAAARAIWRKADEPAPEAAAGQGERCPQLRARRTALAGSAVGLLTGFFGVGGGFLIVPTLAIGLAFTMRAAVATSLAIVTSVAVIGFGAHLAAGRSVDVPVVLTTTGACIVGALGGAAIAGRLPQRALGRGFAVFVAVVAAYLLASVAFLGGPPGSA